MLKVVPVNAVRRRHRVRPTGASAALHYIMLPWPSRVVSSYCTSQSGCSLPLLRDSLPSVNTFSITSYYLAAEGTLQLCDNTYAPCNWTWQSRVTDASMAMQMNSGLVAQPLVFSNSGDMVRSFRKLAALQSGFELQAAYLRDQSNYYNFRRIQLDLEPSCWAKNASSPGCEWPTHTDANNYVRFVNVTAEALATVGAEVSVAVGAWPKGQCTATQEAACTSGGYPSSCESGAWPVSLCSTSGLSKTNAIQSLIAKHPRTHPRTHPVRASHYPPCVRLDFSLAQIAAPSALASTTFQPCADRRQRQSSPWTPI